MPAPLPNDFRSKIAECAVTVGQSALSVTVSIGVSAAYPYMDSIDELMKQADIALYEAKRSGRNRVCRSEMRSA